MSEPYFPRHANSPIGVAPKWKCGECKAEFPPHEEGGLFEHMRTHLAAVVTEHCANCTRGVITIGGERIPCFHDRGAARVAAAVVTEHCKTCNGTGQTYDSYYLEKFVPCLHCRNGRRTRPASSPESAVALDEEPRPALEEMAAALREKARQEYEAEELEHLRCVADNWERAFASAKAAHLATRVAIAATLGGEVEGAPTSTLNYLQRARALVEIERRRDEHEAEMEHHADAIVVERDALRERLATAERERDEWWKRWNITGEEGASFRAQVETLTKERDDLDRIVSAAGEAFGIVVAIPQDICLHIELLQDERDELRSALQKRTCCKGCPDCMGIGLGEEMRSLRAQVETLTKELEDARKWRDFYDKRDQRTHAELEQAKEIFRYMELRGGFGLDLHERINAFLAASKDGGK